MNRPAFLTILCGLLGLASPAIADPRVCTGGVTGPAGSHVVRLLLNDGVIERGIAAWNPPNQTAHAGRRFSPTMSLYYRLTDVETGATGPLIWVHAFMGAPMSATRATEASVRIRRYGERQWAAVTPWSSFASAREGWNSGSTNYVSERSSVSFGGEEVLALFNSAPQIEAQGVSNLNEELSSGIFNLTYRVANDALFERAFQEAVRVHRRDDCEEPDFVSRALFRLRE